MKKGDVKRAQIMDAAERLFLEKGYERTSVQDILDALEMSKGGFYHYFSAKDGVLEAVMERRIARRVEKLTLEATAARRNPVDQLNRLLRETSLIVSEEAGFAALMLKLCYVEKDPSLWLQRRRALMEKLLPTVEAVVDAGLSEGAFFSRHPAQLGRMLMLLAFDVDEEAAAMLAAAPGDPDAALPVIELVNAYRDAAEALLGAEHGAIQLIDIAALIARCCEIGGAMEA